MIVLLCAAGGTAFVFYNRKGFNYNMNIGFHKKRGTTIHEFTSAMQEVPSTSVKDDQFMKMQKEKVPFSTTEKPEYTEIVNSGFGHSVYPVEEEFQDLMNIYDSDSCGKGALNSDDDDNDHQRLIR